MIATQATTEQASVLSIQQPHADLILNGAKWCENRTWRTHYRGELFIHASREDRFAMRHYEAQGVDPRKASPLGCKTGHIIGSVDLYDCVPIEDMQDVQEAIEAKAKLRDVPEKLRDLYRMLKQAEPWTWDFVCGDWCWILTDPEPLIEPIPTKGKLGIWKFDLPL